jgi:hypothetical protein
MPLDRFIYCLVDPMTDKVVWVGSTCNPQERLNGHLQDKYPSTQKGAWMRWLRGFRMRPSMIVLEVTHIGKVREAEDAWIKFMLADGAPLMNARDGYGRPLPWRTGDMWYKPQLRAS